MRISTFSFVLVAALIAPPAVSAVDTHAPHWTYDDPAAWGDLSPKFRKCKLGKQESPIDISTKATAKAKLPAIGFNYKAGAATVVNNGHTVQVDLADAGSVKLAGGDYSLLQFHFHTPSEEKIDGKSYPMDAHLVHQNASGHVAVVGVLFKEGKENAALKSVLGSMPAKEGDKVALKNAFNPAGFLPKNQGYYAYKGSLTTPPCSQGVAWRVLKEPVELSKAQIDSFRKLYKMNARPVQPLYGRKVQESS